MHICTYTYTYTTIPEVRNDSLKTLETDKKNSHRDCTQHQTYQRVRSERADI